MPITSEDNPSKSTESDFDPCPADALVERLLGEGLISMSKAASLCGEFRGGKGTHPSTLVRWSTRGVRLAGGGVLRLETVRLGGRRATSRAALARFVAAQQPGDKSAAAVTVTPKARSRSQDRASARLDDLIGRAG